MRKLIFLACLLFAWMGNAQDAYFTVYNFSVESEDVSTVYKLFDDYFTANKPEGVMVSLYENHFNDPTNNFTHSVVFSGTLDNLGNMYDNDGGDAWSLFITRVNQHMKDGFSSASGTRWAIFGDASQQYRFQRYYIIDAEDTSAMVSAYNAYNEEHNPEGRLTMMGGISMGHGPDGANVWVINGFKDFKTALGGAGQLRTEADSEASRAAWQKMREDRGETRLVRSGLRILLKSW